MVSQTRHVQEVVKAFVVLKPQFLASDELNRKLQEYVRSRLSKHAYPKEIEFVAGLPKTSVAKFSAIYSSNRKSPKCREFKKQSSCTLPILTESLDPVEVKKPPLMAVLVSGMRKLNSTF